MNWLQVALGVISLCNLAFLIGAMFLLYRIVDATEDARTQLLKASQHITESGNHLMVVTRRSILEMERMHDAQSARENSGARVMTELSRQVHSLSEHFHAFEAAQTTARERPPRDSDTEAALRAGEDMRAKLRADLNIALAKNIQLQDEIDQTKYRLKDASSANTELCQQITDVKGMKKNVQANLLQRAAELEEQLQKARERAKAAELLAERNAVQLDGIREQVQKQHLLHKPEVQVAGVPVGPDQSGLIQSQQDMIDTLAVREKSLMERIAAMEESHKRNQTEKEFIEERFLQFDSEKAPSLAPAT